MKTHFYPRSRSGFTLVELLVVISIIMVLAAMGFGAIAKVNQRKNELVTKTCVTDLSMALDQFYNTYSRFPSVGSADELTAEGQAGTELLKILLAKEDPGSELQNPQQIVFLTPKIASNKNQGGLVYSGNQIEGMYDAWGRPLHIKFDEDSDNEIPNPFRQGEVVRQKRVIVWSFGPDGKFGDNDEVKSW
ncbi:type II secretion system GspH family protein [Luteolibacter arcticus]|uniref:Type II secretion system GspH family protein n=1 Tax=Luteolibacter arcticus TaxID=1581411 RepID=A0ABT3GD14_9BACT|nr:type II secretion system GspH family protein [Luteolibacter arcticus]MCW1921511.1 type II secretion system GspH family protein [Luteolibacter arcticus]